MWFKSIILFALFSFIGMNSMAQITVTFEDETTMELDGTLFGTYKKYSYSNPDEVELIERSFYKWDSDTLEIAIYGEFVTKVMDDLRIYHIHKNQLNFDDFLLKEETDVDGKFLQYSLNFSALDTEFNYTSYSYGSSIGDKLSFSFFTVNADEIEGLEALEHLITIY